MFSISGDPILYWTLKTILLIILFVCGYLISFRDKDGSKYWLYGIPAIVAYSLEYGLRWNRSFDYPHYYQDLTGTLYQEYSDPLYLLWVDIIKLFGIDPIAVFVFYSAILFFAFMLLLKEKRELAFLALPLFMIIPTQADNHIRQYFAFSFIMIGYYFDMKNLKSKAYILYLIGLGIHLSGVFCVAFIQFFKYVKLEKIIKSPWIIICLYLMLYFLWDSTKLEGFADWLSKFHIIENERMQGYIDNAEYWFTDESDINEKLGVKTVASKLYFVVINLVTQCGIMYFGFRLIRKDEFLIIPYWSIVWCYFNGVIGGNNEIFSRFNSWVDVFCPFIVSAILLTYKFKTNIKILSIILFCYFYIYVGHIRRIWQINMTGYEYVWDK